MCVAWEYFEKGGKTFIVSAEAALTQVDVGARQSFEIRFCNSHNPLKSPLYNHWIMISGNRLKSMDKILNLHARINGKLAISLPNNTASLCQWPLQTCL